MLTTPNGRPIGQKTVQVSTEQVAAIGHATLDAQVAKLLALGMPHLAMIDVLIDLLTNLAATAEPAIERGALVKQITKKIEETVAKKAGQRMIQSAVMPTSPHRMV